MKEEVVFTDFTDDVTSCTGEQNIGSTDGKSPCIETKKKKIISTDARSHAQCNSEK